MQKSSEQKLDLSTWRNFVAIARPFFVSGERYTALLLAATIVALSLSVTRLNVWMSEITGSFMNALTERNSAEFYRYLLYFALAVLCTTPFAVFYRFTEEKFSLAWRRWLTNYFLERYFSHRSYYRINLEKTLDNPDQRMVDEIRIFTGTSISFMLILFNSVINLFAWSYVLWSISPHLTGAAFIYAFIGSLLTMLIGRRLVALNFAQVKKEADFRYSLVKIRDNSEPIALYRGEEREAMHVGAKLRDALRNLNKLIRWNRNLGFLTRTYDYFRGIIPVLIVAPLYFEQGVNFKMVTQASIAFAWVLDALSLIVSQFERLSAFAATVSRLSALSNELDKGDRYCVWPRESPAWITIGTSDQLSVQNLTVQTPDRRCELIKDLNFSLQSGETLLISGPSGIGKTSLFRALAGLWSEGHGTIMRPELEQVVFLPQTPYMIMGTFRQQLRYSLRDNGETDVQFEEALDKAGLSGLLERIGGFDTEYNWSNMLSLGEQQRVAFARLFLAAPEIAFLDEATTALDLENERKLYGVLAATGRSYVSIGHRESLKQFHKYHLELTGEGAWRLSDIV